MADSTNINPNREAANAVFSLTKHRGFHILMNEHDRAGQELLTALLNAVDDPKIPTLERKELVYQIACNLKANRAVNEAVNSIILNGFSQKDLADKGLIPKDETNQQ